jgi:peptidoglycan/xylan/chitin deacetylase (PgdA/CDA1 family)
MEPHGVMFHHFCEHRHTDSLGAITAERLEKIILSYSPGRILPALEWYERALVGKLEESDVCITFDDSLRSQVEIALPILRKHDITAFWFIYSSIFEDKGNVFELFRQFYNNYFTTFGEFFSVFLTHLSKVLSSLDLEVQRKKFSETDYLCEFKFYSDSEREYRYFRDRVLGREKFTSLMNSILASYGVTHKELSKYLWMVNDDLKELSDQQHIIGLHSYSHPTEFCSLTYQQQLMEYQLNARHIQRVTGKSPKTMAHPVNSYNAETLNILATIGVEVGFRANMQQLVRSQLEYPREDCVDIKIKKE